LILLPIAAGQQIKDGFLILALPWLTGLARLNMAILHIAFPGVLVLTSP